MLPSSSPEPARSRIRIIPRWDWARLNETCWRLLSQGKINCEDVLDPVVSFEEAGDAYREYVVENPSLSVKMGVKY